MIGAQRFHNRAAISPPGDGPTFYIEPEDAEKLALALLECTADIRARPFEKSQFPALSWREREGKQ